MKLSRFNMIFEHKNSIYLTNTFSKGILQINDEYRSIFDQNKLDSLTSDDWKLLFEKGFAVEDELDEIGMLRYRSNILKNSKEEMEFVIAPTLSCNFNCSYCFETPRKGVMSNDTQKQVLKFIFEKTNTDENKRIHIIWFGGEPLLYPEIVIDMNSQIYDYCKNNNKQLQCDVITNGYLLTKELIDKLQKSHINHLQITLDGNKNIHDNRRMLKDGTGTYDTIYENLKSLKDSPITVTIRINIDKQNINNFEQLEKDIEALNNSNIFCSPALVETSEKHLTDIANDCYFDECGLCEFYKHPNISRYFSHEKGSDFSLRLFFCEAEHFHSYAIDELGNIYKCWNSLGVEKDVLCTVFDETFNPAILSTFFARDPFTESRCRDCSYIPICAGGCLMQKKLHNNVNFCSDSKFTFLNAVKKEIDNTINCEQENGKEDIT